MDTKNHGRERKPWKWIVTAIVVILVIWSFKWIWPGHRYEHGWDHRRGGHHWMELSQAEMNERMEHGAEWAFKKLDTTDNQEEVIEEVLEDLIPEIVDLREEHLELKDDFRAALEKEKLDREEMKELLEDGKALMSQAMDQGLEAFITIWETLTVKQRKEVLEHWER